MLKIPPFGYISLKRLEKYKDNHHNLFKEMVVLTNVQHFSNFTYLVVKLKLFYYLA